MDFHRTCMFSDIAEIRFGISNGQISSIFHSYLSPHVSGGVLVFSLKDLVCRKAQESQKFSPLWKMVENLTSVSNPLEFSFALIWACVCFIYSTWNLPCATDRPFRQLNFTDLIFCIMVNVLKFRTLYSIQFILNLALYIVVRKILSGMTDSVDPDQTAPRSSLIWGCTVCICHFVSNFDVRKFRTFTVSIG